MSNVYFIGDPHFGHTNIIKFRTQFPSEGVHRKYIITNWCDRITKRDVVYVMGDAAFTQEGLDDFGLLPGRKILIKGNHDLLPTEAYLKVFEEIHGALAYKGLWLTHIPVHPQELYGRSNVHGHCHRGGPEGIHQANCTIRGHAIGSKATYFNTCCEFIEYTPINYHEIKRRIDDKISKGDS